jgi:hypothetical protein
MTRTTGTLWLAWWPSWATRSSPRSLARKLCAFSISELTSRERHERDVAEVTPTIEALVRKHEASQPATSVPDAERAALAREIMEATRAREIFSYLPDAFSDTNSVPKGDSKISPQMLEAFKVVAVASFRTDRVLASLERRLAEMLDAATLRVALQWERSELGRRISFLDLEGAKPVHNAEKKTFSAQFISKGGIADDTRGRACAQKGIWTTRQSRFALCSRPLSPASRWLTAYRRGSCWTWTGLHAPSSRCARYCATRHIKPC